MTREQLVGLVQAWLANEVKRIVCSKIGCGYFADGMQIVNAAAWKSVEKFDPSLGWKLVTYLRMPVRRVLLNFVDQQKRQGCEHLQNDCVYSQVADRPPDKQAELDDSIRVLRREIDRLPSICAEILRYRYGLDGQEALTLRQCGQRLGMDWQKVRYHEKKALNHLRFACASEA